MVGGWFLPSPPAAGLGAGISHSGCSQPTARFYPGGFTNQTDIAGSIFLPPTANRVLAFTNAAVAFTHGNLAVNFTNDVMLNMDSKVVNIVPNKLALTLQRPTGLFSGSATPPSSAKSVSFRGAVLQKQNRGSGFFLGINQSGRVLWEPSGAIFGGGHSNLGSGLW